MRNIEEMNLEVLNENFNEADEHMGSIISGAFTSDGEDDNTGGEDSGDPITPTLPTLGDLAVGSSINLNVDGVLTEFIIIQQGVPSLDYDSSCDGTWLMPKDIYILKAMAASSTNNYSASAIHTYLNGDYINLFDEDIRNAIKTVRIPYSKGAGSSGSLATGADGLETKAFLLSAAEMDYSSNYARIEGAPVSYFDGVDNTQKIASYNGTATIWWLRSPNISGSTTMFYVRQTNGALVSGAPTNKYGVRPAFILPSSINTDENGNLSVVSTASYLATTTSADTGAEEISGVHGLRYNETDKTLEVLSSEGVWITLK